MTFPQSLKNSMQLCYSFSLYLTDKSARSRAALHQKVVFELLSFCFKERSRRGEKRGNFSVTSDETLPSQPRDPVAKNFLHSYDFLIFSFILLENHSKSLILDLRIRFLKEIGFKNNLVIEKSLKIGKIA